MYFSETLRQPKELLCLNIKENVSVDIQKFGNIADNAYINLKFLLSLLKEVKVVLFPFIVSPITQLRW